MFLTNAEYEKIKPYLNDVISMDIKDYPWKKNKEIFLEYSDGKKMIGNLKASNFALKELSGITSIVEYFARGKYGSTSWRGNCSGLLIKDLLLHFKPKHPMDVMCGSGTFGDVADELGLDYDMFDLNPKWGGFNALKDELPRSSDFIFVHPPYFVYPDSTMPQYSGKMWGNEPDKINDGSWIQDEAAFTKWFNQIQANLYEGLRKGGRIAYLMGDSRSKGQYYSMFKNMDIYGDLENVIVKRQFNTMSDSMKYSGKFIPIEHEYLVIIRKNDAYIVKCLTVKKQEINIMDISKIKWRHLIQSSIEKLGGKATRKEIVNEIKNHPKAKNNNHIEEKVRQIINMYPQEFKKDNQFVFLAA